MPAANRYDQRNIDTMEMVWGRGYMSAGGDAEVACIVAKLDLRGQHVLDLGCGIGGASITLARDHGAARVVGADIDDGVLERAQALVNEAGLSETVSLERIEPGPLPYADASFDVVYLNAVSCHLQDLVGFFADIRRVLCGGGSLRGSDWFKLADNSAFRKWDGLLRDRGLNFWFVTREHLENALREAGFDTLTFVDRTAGVAEIASDGTQRVQNELRAQLEQQLGNLGYADFVDWTRARNELVAAWRHGTRSLSRAQTPCVLNASRVGVSFHLLGIDCWYAG